MSPSDAKLLLRTLLAKGILEKKGDYIRASSDLSSIDLPLAYKPSKDVMDAITSKSVETFESKKETEPDLFHILMDVATSNGIQTRDFVPACTKIQKKLGIDISAAALIVLRDNGVDISPYLERVYSEISVAHS